MHAAGSMQACGPAPPDVGPCMSRRQRVMPHTHCSLPLVQKAAPSARQVSREEERAGAGLCRLVRVLDVLGDLVSLPDE
jgi:hypothetical protein